MTQQNRTKHPLYASRCTQFSGKQQLVWPCNFQHLAISSVQEDQEALWNSLECLQLRFTGWWLCIKNSNSDKATHIAAPSRRCAATMPANSLSFLRTCMAHHDHHGPAWHHAIGEKYQPMIKDMPKPMQSRAAWVQLSKADRTEATPSSKLLVKLAFPYKNRQEPHISWNNTRRPIQ